MTIKSKPNERVRSLWQAYCPDIPLTDTRWLERYESWILTRGLQITAEVIKNGRPFAAMDEENVGRYVVAVINKLTEGSTVKRSGSQVLLKAEVWFQADYRITERDEARFKSKLQRSLSSDCLLFSGASTTGAYGKFSFRGRSVTAHFFAFFLEKRFLPAANALGGVNGLQVAHSCGNRSCCNPRHLRLTTKRVNLGERIYRTAKPLPTAFNVDYGSTNSSVPASSTLCSSQGSQGASSVLAFPQVDVPPSIEYKEVSNGSPPPVPERPPRRTTHFLAETGRDEILEELQGMTGSDGI